MPRKKTTEPDIPEQASGLEPGGLTGEEHDALPASLEDNASEGALAGVQKKPAEDAAQEEPLPPSAEGAAAVTVELPPTVHQEPPEGDVPSGGRDAPSGMELIAEPEFVSHSASPREKNDRQMFYGLDFNELDRGLTSEERQEWNSIYASYRGRSALTGSIIGIDPLSISVRNKQTGTMERQTMYCAVVVPYRVRIVIPASEMWEDGQERPNFVLQNMVGAVIDFIIIKVDRESGFAVASRRMAARSQRYYFAHRPALYWEGARTKCRVLSVGPRRCLVECYGHDINLTQRDLRYTAIPDLRDAYHPGEELDCIVKNYDASTETLRISVKETESNPFEGAELRHPVGSRRQAVIAGKYGGGVFCNLPDGTVCMCSYSYQHEDSDFMVGDTVILAVQRYDVGKRQMYGKILSKW